MLGFFVTFKKSGFNELSFQLEHAPDPICLTHAMKTIPLLFLMVVTCTLLTNCRGSGGPAQRVGYEMDRAAYKVGGGIARAGRSIQRAAR